jgi:hypothetical protein
VIASRRDELVFFLLIPAVTGVLISSFGGPPAGVLPIPLGLLFFLTAAPMWWAILHVSTLIAAHALRPLRVPLWAVLTIGSLIALPLVRVHYFLYGSLYLQALGMPPATRAAPMIELSWAFVRSVTWQAAWLWIAWIGLNCLLDYYLGRSRYRLEAPHAPLAKQPDPVPSAPASAPAIALASEPAQPEFLRRVPAQRQGALIAIKAEDHYLKVTTLCGESLIHYRLTDALNELPEGCGIRIHRSHWVAADAIAQVEPAGRNLRLRLVNGVDVPVSQSYKQPVLTFCRSRGLLADPP